jgi:YfiH family protein
VLYRTVGDLGVIYYVSPLLAQAGVPHAFSTREGGISTAPFDSLNLGNPHGSPVQDDQQNIRENYRRLQLSTGMSALERCWVHQVHGGDVVFVRAEHEFSNGAKADALVCDDPRRVVSVRVADCAPILMASEDGRAVAAAHAGWRGVAAGVIPNTIRELRRMSDAPILAAIGPCIGREAFEVGSDVLEQFSLLFGSDAPVDANGNGKGHVDLRRAIELQLLAAGVSADRIESTDRCTHRDATEFYSHRRDRGITGRMAALIAPRALATSA